MAKRVAMAAILAVGFAVTAQATVLTFDDVGPNMTTIPNGYGGFDWTNMSVSDSRADYDASPGYVTGVVSDYFTAYNQWGHVATIAASTFTFTGAYLTAAWNEGLNIDVLGYRNGSLVYSSTVVVDPYAPTWFAFNYMDITSLVMQSYGGVDVIPGGEGVHFVMDNFTFNESPVVPEPATLLLLGVGIAGIGVRRFRR
ncbi:MAG TPA: PEP-CTERM sorting domain-containing protein [Candidatus Hydrogenedentes bacterium]|nr:PEP-CTERM sorting domain-containing protein [Candidatus Hydrogenedentota bacterium]